MKKSIILSIVFLFVSLFSFAQTLTGKTFKGHDVLMGARGGFYYLNDNGNKQYLSDAQKATLELTASTSKEVVSVPTAAQVTTAKTKEAVLIDNGSTVTYHGVTFNVETGARGGRFFQYVQNGVVKKHYLAR